MTNERDIVLIWTCVGTVITSLATLIYVLISSRALRAMNLQTQALKSTLEVTWMGLRFEAVQKQIELLDKLRNERHMVYELPSEYARWSDQQREVAEEVIRAFDVYGLMDRNQFVPRALLHQFFAYPATRIWDVTKSYIEAIRRPSSPSNPIGRNQAGHMWEFEKLVQRAKLGPKHPAESNQEDWPPVSDDLILFMMRRLEK